MATANANVKKVLDSLKSKGTIVEEWHDGSEWYRVWSSGLIEQGGATVTKDGLAILTLHKAYSDTNYHATAMFYEDEINNTSLSAKYSLSHPKSTAVLTFKCTFAGSDNEGHLVDSKFTWVAVGF